jgi:hypothetical protein
MFCARESRRERRWRGPSLFETAMSVPADEIEFLFSGTGLVPWAEYLLNPRRLRGSDFLMRWSQGRWSEERLVQAVNDTGRYFALPYGPSGTAPEGDVREFELYFERLEKAGLGKMKRPDLLIVRAADRRKVERLVNDLGGLKELPFTREDDPRMAELIACAVLATECENSLWRAKQMPDYGAALSPQRRLGGKLGLKKSAVVPTVILKEEDRRPLRKWQRTHGVPVHVWHVFYDMAFGIALTDAERLIRSGEIEETGQVFQAPGGATTRKAIYKIYYHHTYPLGEAIENPSLVAESITDKNGHILPYVRFQGGKLALSREVLEVLDTVAGPKSEKPS